MKLHLSMLFAPNTSVRVGGSDKRPRIMPISVQMKYGMRVVVPLNVPLPKTQ